MAKVEEVLMKQKTKHDCPAPAPAAAAAFFSKPAENCAKTQEERCAAVLAVAKKIEKGEPSKECKKLDRDIAELDEAQARCGGSQTCGPAVQDYMAKVEEVLMKQKAKHDCPAPAPAAAAAFFSKPAENCAKTQEERCAAVLAVAKKIEKGEPSKECKKLDKDIA